MSKFLSNLAVKQFEAEVHHEFTGTASVNFKELARTRFIKAKSTQFPVFGYSPMKPHVKGTQLPAANGSRTPVEVTLQRFGILDTTDIFDNSEVNFSERQEFVKSIAKSFANTGMQVLIDALNAGTATATVPTNVSGTADNMTVAAMRKAAELLDANGVPNDGKRVFLMTPSMMHALTREPQVTSTEFVNKQVYNSGKLPDFYGFKIVVVPTMPEGGLPFDGTNTTGFAYHTDAVGLAVGVNQEVTIDWENDYGAWSVAGWLSAGAAVIDSKGFVKVLAKTA